MDPKFFDDLAKHISATVPPGVKELQKDLEQNFRSLLQSTFAKLDLVTREEFDAQARVLARTRAKLEALEQQFAELEEQQKHHAKKSKKDKEQD
jgi:BMFP domain-containing protein YqiC